MSQPEKVIPNEPAESEDPAPPIELASSSPPPKKPSAAGRPPGVKNKNTQQPTSSIEIPACPLCIKYGAQCYWHNKKSRATKKKSSSKKHKKRQREAPMRLFPSLSSTSSSESSSSAGSDSESTNSEATVRRSAQAIIEARKREREIRKQVRREFKRSSLSKSWPWLQHLRTPYGVAPQ